MRCFTRVVKCCQHGPIFPPSAVSHQSRFLSALRLIFIFPQNFNYLMPRLSLSLSSFTPVTRCTVVVFFTMWFQGADLFVFFYVHVSFRVFNIPAFKSRVTQTLLCSHFHFFLASKKTNTIVFNHILLCSRSYLCSIKWINSTCLFMINSLGETIWNHFVMLLNMNYPAYTVVIQVILRPTEWHILQRNCDTEQNLEIIHGILMQLQLPNAGRSAGNKQPNWVHDWIIL